MSPTPDSTLADPQRVIADLKRELGEAHRALVERTAELDEALERQTATAEVLQIINSSPGDLTPVFQSMLETAARLCSADIGMISNREPDGFRVAATFSHTPEYEAFMRNRLLPANRGSVAGRAALERRPVQISDITSDPDYAIAQSAALGNIRTALGVPLLREQVVVGVISLGRNQVQPFTDRQIELLTAFAAQAVIAMENARLITETREALEQQTATSEVLQVINSSPGDLTPVFDAMLEKAMRLCEAAFGALFLVDDDDFIPAALRGVPAAYAEFLANKTILPGPGTAPYRFLRGGERSVIEDTNLAESEAYRGGDPQRCALVDIGGARSAIQVPLCKDAAVLGVMTLYRQEVRPFTDKQIALLENFAAQAVIAMENARLLGDLRERTDDLQQSLEYQTATSDVLKVISSSTFDLQPVLDALVATSTRLCVADQAVIFRREADDAYALVANFGFPPEYEAFQRERGPVPATLLATSPTVLARAARERRVIHVEDVAAIPGYPETSITLGKQRTSLGVPLLREGEPIGAIGLARQRVEPFTERQIDLVRTFADQAVIAIENARLITETREALEQQTATAEVLGVINSSPGNLAPVFDAMLDNATRLCEAVHGTLATYDGEFFRFVAVHGEARMVEEEQARGLLPPSFGVTWPRLLCGDSVVHVTDVTDTDLYRTGHQGARWFVDIGGGRTLLTIALRKEDALLGALTVFRQEVRPFTDKQIALLQNFAAQAVIAMENARLITETREALEQQTATALVLQVINSSPGDLGPVFDAMLEKATVLCEAKIGTLWTYDGEWMHASASRGAPPAFAEFLQQKPTHPLGGLQRRLLGGERFVQTDDLSATEGYRSGNPLNRAAVDLGGVRTLLTVPLRKDEMVLGNFGIYRQEVRPFSEKQIALLENFAAQAVIAMENARLITETREALDQQTATAEILEAINRSPGNLLPVFDVMLDKALYLSEAAFGALMLHEGDDRHRVVAMQGVPPARLEFWTKEPLYLGPGTAAYRHVRGERRPAHITDATEDKVYQSGNPYWRTMVDDDGIRTWLAVPLHKDSILLGTLISFRREMRPFSDKQIALLQGFAAQAVIAMENARLLEEIRKRQAELRVTFDNMVDGVVMFDQELRLAAWNKNFQELLDLPDEFLAAPQTYDGFIRYLGERGEYGDLDPAVEIARLRAQFGDQFRFERTRPDGRVIEVRHNPMPDGGFVLIYSDITARKRSEAEIRAARDAAEATLRELRAAQANLIQAEKMASLGQLTAGIAHEIKNPLNFVNNFASLSNELLEELKEEAEPALATLDGSKRAEIDETIEMLSGNLEKIAEHGKRADNIVKSMLEHSRGVTGERREVDLNILVDEALNLAYHGARAQDASFNITLERAFDPALARIELAPQEITRMFLNLFGNGFYATTKRVREAGNGSFQPILAVTTRDLGDAVEVRVRDNGTGISPEIRDKLFQPFFTTKPTGEGTGLGLSISYDIVTQQHGGTIAVESEAGAFTEFTVRLPRH